MVEIAGASRRMRLLFRSVSEANSGTAVWRSRMPRRTRRQFRGSISSSASSMRGRLKRRPALSAGRSDRLPRADHLSRRRRATRCRSAKPPSSPSGPAFRWCRISARATSPPAARARPLVPYADYLLFRHARRTRVALEHRRHRQYHRHPGGRQGRGSNRLRHRPRQHGDRRAGESRHRRARALRSRRQDGRARQIRQEVAGRTAARSLLPPPAAQERRPGAVRQGVCRAPDGIGNADGRSARHRHRTHGRHHCHGSETLPSGGGRERRPDCFRGRRAQRAVHGATGRASYRGRDVATSGDFGVDPDAKEAIAFALLAYATWGGKPSNVPSATGARRSVLLGSVTPTRI